MLSPYELIALSCKVCGRCNAPMLAGMHLEYKNWPSALKTFLQNQTLISLLFTQWKIKKVKERINKRKKDWNLDSKCPKRIINKGLPFIHLDMIPYNNNRHCMRPSAVPTMDDGSFCFYLLLDTILTKSKYPFGFFNNMQ